MWQHSWVLLFLHGVTLQRRNCEGILKIPRVKLDTNEVNITSMNSIIARKLTLTEEMGKAEAKEGKKESCKKKERERGRESYHHGSCWSNSVATQCWQQWDRPASGQGRTMAQQQAGQWQMVGHQDRSKDNDTQARAKMAVGTQQ